MRNLWDILQYYSKVQKRSIAKEKQDGKGKIQTCKIPLPYLLYYYINQYMLRDNTLESIFARAFLTTTWNLICHATNTYTIHLHHMDWQNNCLCIFFAHMKNNQVGNRKRHPRRIYSNPINPTVCPILLLAIYLTFLILKVLNILHCFQGLINTRDSASI